MILMDFIERNLIDRDQWQTYITNFFDQAMQRSLIDHRAS